VARLLVCESCLVDPVLRRLARRFDTATRCDFCGRASEAVLAAPADSIVAHIQHCLNRSWKPRGETSSGSVDDAWPWVILPFDEVLRHECQPSFASDRFTAYVRGALGVTPWVPRGPELTHGEALKFSWDLFKVTVKHGTRFFFAPDGCDVAAARSSSNPLRRGAEMLRELGRIIDELSLIREVPGGHRVFRLRLHEPDEAPIAAAALGTPPRRAAGQGRMSAAGIPAFYGAADELTARAETTGLGARAGTLATFETTRAMRIVDLCDMPARPSLFEVGADAEATRARIDFLAGLTADIRSPIERDDRIHIDYVPTQVVGEYLRCVFTDRSGEPIDGVAWGSARRLGGRSLVLFVDSSRCIDVHDPARAEGLCLRLMAHRRVTAGEDEIGTAV
jgi:hypothetical protein